MRILHIGKFYPPFHGGMENFLAALIESQVSSGHEVAALVHAHTPTGLSFPPYSSDVLPWIIRAPCYGRLLYAPISPAFPFWLARTLRDFCPDILHFHLPNTSAFWALASSRSWKVPWVIHWHSDVVASKIDHRLKLAYRFYRPFEQAMLKRANAIVVTSPPYLESSLALRDWRAKCHVVPLGLPDLPRRSSGAPDTVGWAPELLRVLAIGRLTYYKGFEVLVRAIAKSPFAQAIIVGEGDERETLKKIIATSGAEHRIKLVGSLPDGKMQILQASCEVFCLPSLERTEAFGMVLLEAMQRAKPVIASDIPGSGAGWVVENGETGLLFPPGDAVALTARLASIKDPQLRIQLGNAGCRRFEQLFRIERVAEALENIYSRLSPPMLKSHNF